MDPDERDGTHVFQRVYMCFSACKKQFLVGCRKIIRLDDCFFKAACFGPFLCALGKDKDNQVYLIARVIVKKENFNSWVSFLDLLNKDP